MAKRSTGGTVLFLLLALILLALSITGKTSDFLLNALKWLLGSKFPVPVAVDKTSKKNDKQPPGNSGANATKVPVTAPSPAPKPVPAKTVQQKADDFFAKNPSMPFYTDPDTHQVILSPHATSGALSPGPGAAAAGEGVWATVTRILGAVAL